jgi:hypothetical protein
LLNDVLNLSLTEFHRFVVARQLYQALISQCVVVLWNEDISSRQLVEFADAFPVIADYKGCDLIWDRNEGVRAWEWIYLKLLLQLQLEFRLLLKCLLGSKSI